MSESGTSAAFLAGLAGDLAAALVGFAAGFAAAFASAAGRRPSQGPWPATCCTRRSTAGKRCNYVSRRPTRVPTAREGGWQAGTSLHDARLAGGSHVFSEDL